MPSADLAQVQPLWLQVLDRWPGIWPHVDMVPALMQILAALLQKMCYVMAELCRSDSPAKVSFFEKHHQSAQELYSELCHQLVTLPAQDKELIKVAPAYGQFNITLPDKSKLTLKALLPREWSRVCSMYWQVLTTAGGDVKVKPREVLQVC
ncbi:hypothetical protein WJX82_010337 [Trebouxia sp. C0006]